MKVVIAGGNGQVGQVLTRFFRSKQDEVTILCRTVSNDQNSVVWDGKTPGDWERVVDGADVVINLAGRSVNCRYTESNLRQMMDSRVDSTRVIGQAIEQAKHPPKVWLQASTATIYAHTFETANDEVNGVIGGKEPDVPAYWKYSIDIAQAWEKTLAESHTPDTRKVALRSAMIMSPDKGGIFDVLSGLTRLGLGGTIAGGSQFVSWVHESDFIRIIDFLLKHEEISGAVNVCAPNPLPQKEFMLALRAAWRIPIGLPAAKWMIEIGAFFMRSDSELILKSRKVVPKRLLDAGYAFTFPDWPEAAGDLVRQMKMQTGR